MPTEDVRISRDMLETVRRQSSVDYVLHFASLPSTNDRAKQDVAKSAPVGLGLYIADEQTAGRGRGSNRWISGPGSLQFSLVWPLHQFSLPESDWPRFSLACGLAVCKALEQIDPQGSLHIKWPNDVYLEDQKVAGLLLEPGPNKACIIVGVGCNVHNDLSSLPPNVAARATRLADYMPDQKKNYLGDVLLAMVIRLQTAMLRAMGGSLDVHDAWAERCWLTGKHVKVIMEGTHYKGRCAGLSEDGALLVETDRGTEKCYSGTVEQVS